MFIRRIKVAHKLGPAGRKRRNEAERNEWIEAVAGCVNGSCLISCRWIFWVTQSAQEKNTRPAAWLEKWDVINLARPAVFLPTPHAIAATLETIHCVADNILSVISKGNEGEEGG